MNPRVATDWSFDTAVPIGSGSLKTVKVTVEPGRKPSAMAVLVPPGFITSRATRQVGCSLYWAPLGADSPSTVSTTRATRAVTAPRRRLGARFFDDEETSLTPHLQLRTTWPQRRSRTEPV